MGPSAQAVAANITDKITVRNRLWEWVFCINQSISEKLRKHNTSTEPSLFR